MPLRRGRPGLLGTVARTAVITGTATAVHGAMTGARTSQQQQAAADQAAADAQAQQAVADAQARQAVASPAAAGPGSGDDVIARIRELGELKQQGLISDEEFAALKAKLISTA